MDPDSDTPGQPPAGPAIPGGGSVAGHVFVSYARPDRARVAVIVQAVESAGRVVWWDHDLAGGAAFAREIETALRAADAVMVVWSGASVQSDWVRDEAAVGRDLGRLVPVSLDGASPPLGFGQYHAVDLSGWNGRSGAPEIARLLHALDRAAGTVGGAAPAALPLRRGPPRRAFLIGAGLAAPLVLAGAGWFGLRLLPGRPVAPARSIAVLPFANLSGDPAQDYFSDGLTEEMIGALARLPALQVAGRTSSFSPGQFKASRQNSAAIGAALGVAYLLDGSVRRQGEGGQDQRRARRCAQRLRARWSQSYDHDLKDILATQTSIAQAVAQQLKAITLVGGEIASLAAGGTTNPTAYDTYLQGRRVFSLGGSESDYRAALASFDAAVAADPGFAAAWSARARVLLSIGDNFADPATHDRLYGEALSSARRAVALAPGLGEAQATLADTLATAVLDFAGARAAYARAMATGDGQADVLARFGLFSCDVGDIAPGLAAVRRAVVLDPLNANMFAFLARALVAARLYPDAIAAVRQALALSPGLGGAHVTIGDALFFQGDLAAAAVEYALEPIAYRRQTALAIVRRRLGDPAGAEAAYQGLLRDPDQVVAFYQQAQVLAQWGMTDQAFAALQSAVKARDSGLVYVKTDRLLEPLRTDPRFPALLLKLGLGA